MSKKNNETSFLYQIADESSQHSLADGGESSCGADGPDKPINMADELNVVDLRLKSERSRDSQSSQVCFPLKNLRYTYTNYRTIS